MENLMSEVSEPLETKESAGHVKENHPDTILVPTNKSQQHQIDSLTTKSLYFSLYIYLYTLL